MTGRLAPQDLAGTAYRYDPEQARFVVPIPGQSNIAADTIGRHARGDRAHHPALVFEHPDGRVQQFTYQDVDTAASALAVALKGMGIARGDRVAVHSVQRPETVIAHMAIYKLAAVATTVSRLTAADTMAWILEDSGARVMITHADAWAPFRTDERCTATLEHVVVMDGNRGGNAGNVERPHGLEARVGTVHSPQAEVDDGSCSSGGHHPARFRCDHGLEVNLVHEKALDDLSFR